MPEGFFPQLAILFAVPVVAALAALAFVAGHRRERARRARASLGQPTEALDETFLGERVVLEGTIEHVSTPCARFEDGAPCAAATVESAGPRALPDASTEASPTAESASVAHSTRAASIVLHVATERVIVVGPVDVLVGSVETDPVAPLADLAAQVRERVATAAENAALPAPNAVDDARAHPLFRSVSEGDHVHVAGRLAKQSEGDRKGYRERATWVLGGDAKSPVVVAYAHTPNHRGAVLARLRGLRLLRLLDFAIALVPMSLAAIGVATTFFRPTPARSAKPLQPRNGMVRHFADQTRCTAIKKEYVEWATHSRSCTASADCAVDVRGGTYFGLEGCYRFRNIHSAETSARSIEKAWLDEGCATTYEICPEAPLAMCRQGVCVEEPPAPLPSTWNREDVPGGFFLYVPPEMKRIGGIGDNSVLAQYEGGGISMAIDYVAADSFHREEEEPGRPVTIGGYKAHMWSNEHSFKVVFEKIKPCLPPRCSPLIQGDALLVHADCNSDQACENAWKSIDSIQFW